MRILQAILFLLTDRNNLIVALIYMPCLFSRSAAEVLELFIRISPFHRSTLTSILVRDNYAIGMGYIGKNHSLRRNFNDCEIYTV